MRAENIISMVLILLLSGCGNIYESADFERHRYSQFAVPYDRNDVMYFDVTFNAQYPDNDESAEESAHGMAGGLARPEEHVRRRF